MRRRDFIIGGAAAFACAWPMTGGAQQASMPVIGFLSGRSSGESSQLVAAFLAGLRAGGFIAGDNVAIEYRWARGQRDQLPGFAADLVARKVSVIVAVGGAERAAKAATATTPIVFVTGTDPVMDDVVASLSRPGGNLTGVSILTTGLEAKRLDFLHDLVPQAKSIAVLIDSNMAAAPSQRGEVNQAARTLGLSIHLLDASTDHKLDEAMAAIADARDQALLVLSSPFLDTRRDRIVAEVQRVGIPAIYQFRDYVTTGGLMSYGIDIGEAYQRAGGYTARILKGERPSDLPVQQPAKFELVINMKAARALGITVSPTLLALADEVIE